MYALEHIFVVAGCSRDLHLCSGKFQRLRAESALKIRKLTMSKPIMTVHASVSRASAMRSTSTPSKTCMAAPLVAPKQSRNQPTAMIKGKDVEQRVLLVSYRDGPRENEVPSVAIPPDQGTFGKAQSSPK